MWVRISFVLTLVLVPGCGSKVQYARVSGKVTLNGSPLANAVVGFEPINTDGTLEAPAPSSSGKTNASGEYTLMTTTKIDGAWVGKHRVTIILLTDDPADDRPSRPKPDAPKIPRRYNVESKEEFEVTSSGTDTADFKLTSP